MQENIAQVAVGLREIRVEVDCLAITSRCFVQQPLLAKNVTQVEVRRSGNGVQQQRLTNVLRRQIKPSDLPRQKAKKMPSIRVQGFRPHNLPIKVLRQLQISRPMMPHGKIKSLGQNGQD